MKKKSCLTIVLSMMLSLSSTICVQAVSEPTEAVSSCAEQLSYTDISADDEFYYAVAGLESSNVHIGKDGDSFSPSDIVSKGDFIDMLYQFEKAPDKTESDETDYAGYSVFENVSVNQSDREAINWALANKIALGTSSKIFSPDKSISCQEMVVMLYRYAQSKEYISSYNTYLENYEDSENVSQYAENAVNWGISCGLLQPDGSALEIEKTLTRSEAAVYLYRFIKNVINCSDDNLADNYGIYIEFPSAAQQTIEPGRDFYVIGEFVGNIDIPDDAHVEVTLVDSATSKTVRTIYSNKKNDYDSLNVNYKYLNVWSDDGNREEFRKAGMPDLVYDQSDPSSFDDTWIKCFYSDKRVSASVFGGAFTRNVNDLDQFGKKLGVLDGDYLVRISVTTSDESKEIAYAEEPIVIGTYPDKSVSPFQPDEHFEELKQVCAENDYEIFLDPFPGYWNCSFINPDWGEDYYGTITAKWKFMDATEYNSGNIHFYIYNVGSASTSYNVEIGEIEAHDGNLNRLSCYYYDFGEPSLNGGKLKGTLRKMDTDTSPIAFTRAEYHTSSTTLGDNHVDMRTLDDVTVQRVSATDSVVCSAGQTVSLYGVCAPIMSKGSIEMNPATSTFDLNNRIEKIVYTIEGESGVYEKSVGLIRENPTTNLEATDGIFEFKHDFFIPDDWSGKTLELTFSAYDSFGNCVAENVEGPTFYVTKESTN